MKTRLLGAVAIVTLALAANAKAQDHTVVPLTSSATPPAKPASSVPGAADTEVSDIVVTARRLNEARASIQPSLGATTYTVTNATIQALPGGDNQSLNQIVLQLPGVTQDGAGQIHVRDDHNNIQYRINGVILPEGVAVFGQTLSPRLVEKLDLITGALPAQYGLRTAGIIDVTTKSGVFQNGGQASIYGGSHGTYEPSFEYGGSSGGSNFFVSGDFRRSQLGIESVDGRSTPVHDRTDQATLFTYFDRNLSANDRVSLVGGYSNQRFQIPNPVGLQPDGGYSLGGDNAFASEQLNERQREVTGFAQASLLHDSGPITLQASLFARYSSLTYTPDVVGELLFNGQAQAADKTDTALGLQFEGVYRLNLAHTLRAGLVLQSERGISRTSTQVFPVDTLGAQIGQPVTLNDRSGKTQTTESVYLQDEWKLTPDLTLNYGGRFDAYDGYRAESQFSPRVNIVWEPLDGTTLHAGYARYFSPAPFELVGSQTVALFQGTSAGSAVTDDTTPYAERQDYYDVGVHQKVSQLAGLSVGLDGYYRRSRNLVDEGQFGAPIIQTPFNYRSGKIAGLELSVNYAHGPWLTYANVAYARALGKDIVSSQFNFAPDELAFIQNHYIFLDHDQTYTASAGVSYNVRQGWLGGTRVGADLVYGSGLRTDGVVPNGGQLPGYVQVNGSISHDFDLPRFGKLSVRLDVINAFDEVYLIRDGSGVGVGAPQYGPRRGLFAGVTKSF